MGSRIAVKESHPGIDLDQLRELLPSIRSRLLEFQNLPSELYPRELLLCVFTPQSNPYHAEHAVTALEARGFFTGEEISQEEIEEILRSPTRYVRFHRVKATRALQFRERLPSIVSFLEANYSPHEEREFLVRTVSGYGLKEASHALRNIGRRGLAILDRHILRNLHSLGVIPSLPISLSERRYREIEENFVLFCQNYSLDMDELDLYFWWRGAGTIFK